MPTPRPSSSAVAPVPCPVPRGQDLCSCGLGPCRQLLQSGAYGVDYLKLTSIHVKVTDCDPLKQCLMVAVPGEAYLSGQFCPVENRMQLPVYSMDGVTDDSTLYLHKFDTPLRSSPGAVW